MLQTSASGVKTALETIFEKYALKFSGATSAIKEEQAIAELSKLCSQSISKTNLENLLKYIGTDAAKASTFANDLEKYALLDDFAKDGQLLENYIAVHSGNYAGFKYTSDKVSSLYKQMYNFLSNEGYAKMAGSFLMKEYGQAQQLARQLGGVKISGDIGSSATQGIEGVITLSSNSTKIPYSLKYLETADSRSLFETIATNADKIKKGYDKGVKEIVEYCAFNSNANTYLRINTVNLTKLQIVAQYNANINLPNGFGILFGPSGVFKQIKIIDKVGEEVIFNNYILVN